MKTITNNDIKIEVNNDIETYLYPKENTELLKLTNSDRLYMLSLLKQYYLSLREKIGIDKRITFGLELEFENLELMKAHNEISKLGIKNIWFPSEDGSLLTGGEIVSPKLRDYEESWLELAQICNILTMNGATIEDTTGGHIHIGMHILGNNPKYWANFVKIWATYEHIIFRFLYGEYNTPRSGIINQARPISKEIISNLERIEDRAKSVSAYSMFKVLDAGPDFKTRRKRAVNFTNTEDLDSYNYDQIIKKNTIEFRSPNGTLNPVIWQNNVNLLVHLFEYAKSDNFNEELITRRMIQILNDDIPSRIIKYRSIYINQAIELADLIFNNNLDKIYFLKQYIKSGEVSRNYLVKSKTFTK